MLFLDGLELGEDRGQRNSCHGFCLGLGKHFLTLFLLLFLFLLFCRVLTLFLLFFLLVGLALLMRLLMFLLLLMLCNHLFRFLSCLALAFLLSLVSTGGHSVGTALAQDISKERCSKVLLILHHVWSKPHPLPLVMADHTG